MPVQFTDVSLVLIECVRSGNLGSYFKALKHSPHSDLMLVGFKVAVTSPIQYYGVCVTPLALAIAFDEYSITRFFIEELRADVNMPYVSQCRCAQYNCNRNATRYPVQNVKSIDMLRLLMKYNVNLNVHNEHGGTLLHEISILLSLDFEEIYNVLHKELGITADSTDMLFDTPLHNLLMSPSLLEHPYFQLAHENAHLIYDELELCGHDADTMMRNIIYLVSQMEDTYAQNIYGADIFVLADNFDDDEVFNFIMDHDVRGLYVEPEYAEPEYQELQVEFQYPQGMRMCAEAA